MAIHNDNLKVIKQKIIDFGCEISVDIFLFSDGRRFQLIDPSDKELAIWNEE